MRKKMLVLLLPVIFIAFVASLSLAYSEINKNELPEDGYTNIKPKKYFEIISFEIKNKEVYLALNDTKNIEYNLEVDSNYEEELTFTSKDNNIATVNEDGLIRGINPGTTEIEIQIKDEVRTLKVTVTDLINKIEGMWNKNKPLLTCKVYSEEQNDLLDAILRNRIDEAGYATRAGVLAAARFITLEFPYKIGYFSENGRLDKNKYTNYVDGEGRYYHEGLYLHSSRISNITKSMYGPNIWGCQIYSYVSEGYRRNAFDCSGYIAWVLLNGGFDPGDIGSGISEVLTDMTDLGAKENLEESLNQNKLKAGDLLSGPKTTGGHIAMLMGINGDEYYVTECLWGNGDYGVIVRTYNSESLKKYFKWHIDMDSYYLNDGNYTENWF